MELFKPYKMRNGETIEFDGISMYDVNVYGKFLPIDVLSSSKMHGHWTKRGKYLTNVYFLDGEPSEMDIIK